MFLQVLYDPNPTSQSQSLVRMCLHPPPPPHVRSWDHPPSQNNIRKLLVGRSKAEAIFGSFWLLQRLWLAQSCQTGLAAPVLHFLVFKAPPEIPCSTPSPFLLAYTLLQSSTVLCRLVLSDALWIVCAVVNLFASQWKDMFIQSWSLRSLIRLFKLTVCQCTVSVQ